MSIGKRKRQKENRRARRDAEAAVPELTDDDLAGLLVEITVRADCEHAHTRSTSDGVRLIRCAVGASVGGGCPVDCERFERRTVRGYGI